jgi:hypothetical protein
MNRHKNVKEMSGQRFGRLLVLSYEGSNKFRQSLWKCKCDCGEYVVLPRTRLVSKNTTSCGCANKDAVSLPFGIASSNKILSRYKQNAKNRGIAFDLSSNEFLSLIVLDCFYCGASPHKYFELTSGNGGISYNGLDRVNNNKGYTLDNAVPCCEKCNYAKRSMTYDEFKNWIFAVSDHMISKEIFYKTSR